MRGADERVEWIDILKWLGIVAIFCGHLGRETGGLYGFVFSYHVPLFLFVSGIFAHYAEDVRFLEVFRKKFRRIVVPYVFIVMITMPVIVLTTKEDVWTYFSYAKQFVFGIRNRMYASSLWFFSCLFVMSILFEILRRVLRYNVLLLLASCALYVVSGTLFPHNPGVEPSWIFNIDSACYYMIYYAAGYSLRGVLLRDSRLREPQREEADSGRAGAERRRTALFAVAACLTAAYAFLVYIDKDVLWEAVSHMPGADMICPVLRASLLILFQILLAKMLAPADRIAYYGSQTLWLCANEFIVKKILTAAAAILGLEITVQSALSAVVYALVMTVVIMEALVPAEKRLYEKYIRLLDRIMGAGVS